MDGCSSCPFLIGRANVKGKAKNIPTYEEDNRDKLFAESKEVHD